MAMHVPRAPGFSSMMKDGAKVSVPMFCEIGLYVANGILQWTTSSLEAIFYSQSVSRNCNQSGVDRFVLECSLKFHDLGS